MEHKKILVIEDEKKLARFMELELAHEGYSVSIAYDGEEGLSLFNANAYDLILMDLMLPKVNGLEVTRRIRKTSKIPIIMLTARGEVMDKVSGLDSGADDYVTKPFAIEEVLARMRVAFKRQDSDEAQTDKLTLGKLSLDVKSREVSYDANELDLTKTEFELLKYLMENKGIVLSREQILNNVWGYDYMGETNVVDVYVRYLRTKIDERFAVKMIYTARGVGYIAKPSETA
ncbi:DNA-binding response regulator [Clostridia bacterium]|nr:DNA-binding response regulator [Clostridia bacterium]